MKLEAEVHSGNKVEFNISDDEMFRFKNRLCVPNDREIKENNFGGNSSISLQNTPWGALRCIETQRNHSSGMDERRDNEVCRAVSHMSAS